MAGPAPSSAQALERTAHAGMFVFGIVMALIGAVMPALTQGLTLSLAGIGTLFLVMNFAMLLTSLALGLVMDKFGLKLPLALGAGLVAAGLVMTAMASRAAMLLPAVACLGMGGGALNGSTNTLVADLHAEPARKAAALNLLGVFFGVGALVLPFAVGALLSQVGVTVLLWVSAGLCASLALVAAALRFPAPKDASTWPLAAMPRLLRLPEVRSLAFLLFFQSGNEFVLGGFVAAFFVRELAVPIDRAAFMLAAYWAAIMSVRLALSRGLSGIDGRVVVLAGAVLAATGALVVAIAPSVPIALVGVVLVGSSLAGIFPTTLGVAGTWFEKQSGAVFGVLFTVALTGGMLVPWLSGQLAERQGLRAVFVTVAAAFVAVAVLSTLAHRSRRRAGRG